MQTPIPSYTHALRSLAAILAKAETHCDDRKIDPNALLTARLFPDMMNFTRNVLVACDTAKGLAARLSQTENPSLKTTKLHFPSFRPVLPRRLSSWNPFQMLLLKVPSSVTWL